MPILTGWLFWAFLSALFAALTAIFAKIGVTAVNPDLATFLRRLVIVGVFALIVAGTGQFQPLNDIPGRSWLFLVPSGLATGASWLCYFRASKLGDTARVAPVDKLSLVIVALLGVFVLGERLSPGGLVGVVMALS